MVADTRRPSGWDEISMWKGWRDGQHAGIRAKRLCQKATITGALPAQAVCAAPVFTLCQRVVILTMAINAAASPATRLCTTGVRPMVLVNLPMV